MAAVNCSLAFLMFSGFPWETISLYPEMIIKSIAMPPAMLKTIPTKLRVKEATSVLIANPSPVLIDAQVLPSALLAAHESGGPAMSRGLPELLKLGAQPEACVHWQPVPCLQVSLLLHALFITGNASAPVESKHFGLALSLFHLPPSHHRHSGHAPASPHVLTPLHVTGLSVVG